jgi:hypothetical protein
MALVLRQQERSQCALNWHLCFAEIVNEITLHPRPASHSFAGNVETDHPRAGHYRTLLTCYRFPERAHKDAAPKYTS